MRQLTRFNTLHGAPSSRNAVDRILDPAGPKQPTLWQQTATCSAIGNARPLHRNASSDAYTGHSIPSVDLNPRSARKHLSAAPNPYNASERSHRRRSGKARVHSVARSRRQTRASSHCRVPRCPRGVELALASCFERFIESDDVPINPICGMWLGAEQRPVSVWTSICSPCSFGFAFEKCFDLIVQSAF